MALKKLLEELAKLTPEERAALKDVFAPEEKADDGVDQALLSEVKDDLRKIYPHITDASLQSMALKQISAPKTRQAPKPPKAERVYFFKQFNQFVAEEIGADKENPDVLKKTGYYLPARVIAVDTKTASRMYWKQRNKFQFLGSSDGQHWREARERGMPVHEAYGVEYEAMLKAPDFTAPMNREKTVFAGTKMAQINRGVEIDWNVGLKQAGGSHD